MSASATMNGTETKTASRADGKYQSRQDNWYYPPEIAGDLETIPLPFKVKQEIFACAWEYTRCVIPQYTNWSRYVAFMRTIIIGIIAEFRGAMVDITAGDELLGYNLHDVLDALFRGTVGYADMHREYRAFLLITADKASEKRNGDLFRRYVNALAYSPQQWFRMRDCDALARFTIASALACNDLDSVYFSDPEFELLTELGNTMYDAVAFYKHRAEGETNSTFAYMPEDERINAFRQCREILWALDVAWAPKPRMISVINFCRFFGGPIHMMMRRYRFVEEKLTIGKIESQHVVKQTRENFKLWNRIDTDASPLDDKERFDNIMSDSNRLMFPGLDRMLRDTGGHNCAKCKYRESYGAERSHEFGGVKLCAKCIARWRIYAHSLPSRAVGVFPELKEQLQANVRIAPSLVDVNQKRKRVDEGEIHQPTRKYRTRGSHYIELQQLSVLEKVKARPHNRARVGRDIY